ncbi:conserved oligomeric Golgi complex subunit 1 [Cinnamomum micranthum f. kanehirae]|uniref:Conserved oligomeric Golgi complex subunit 1 n=1 Tax=Cinnamomum micranthum f. kanehirae TaxID=337451 RepID=A0A443NYJ7_9MAGN|nr:conserved oligomeric Golgi complex subunit 1 [Cinnamomum micranthum f. kanehirae]
MGNDRNEDDNEQVRHGHSKVAFDTLMPDSPRRQMGYSLRRQSSSAAPALFGVDDSASPKLDELNKNSTRSLHQGSQLVDNMGWEEMVIKQEQSNDGPTGDENCTSFYAFTLHYCLFVPSMPRNS